MDASPSLTKKLSPVGSHSQRKMSFGRAISLGYKPQSQTPCPAVDGQQNRNSTVFLDFFLSDIALFVIFYLYFFLKWYCF